MTWESFNNSILNAMGSYGATYPNYSLMPAFDFSGYANSGDLELSGLLNQNPYTADYSGKIPSGGFNLFSCNQNTMDLVNSIYANFTQQLDAQQAQLQQMLSNFMSNTGAAPYSDEDTSYFSYDAQALKEKWSKKKPNLSDGFYNKVVEVAKRVGCDPNDLMALMNAESGLNPAARNKSAGSTATGLIQFIESTAKRLGTTTAALQQMSAEEQLVYVEKYLKQTKAAAGIGENQKIGAGTLYSLVFLPARSSRNVLTSRGETYYSQNYRLDTNGDGQITKDELGQRVRNFMA